MRIQPQLTHEKRQSLAKQLRELRADLFAKGQGSRSLARPYGLREVAVTRTYRGNRCSLDSLIAASVAGWRNLQPVEALQTDAVEVSDVEQSDAFATPPIGPLSALLAAAEASGMLFGNLTVRFEERPEPYEGYNEVLAVVEEQCLVGDDEYAAYIARAYEQQRMLKMQSEQDQAAYQTYLALRARFEGR